MGNQIVEEYAALRRGVGVLDLSRRSRLCLAGRDRLRFLHGQVTNDIQRLKTGQGCYAALVSAKGKLQSDLNVYCLPEELLLDFEPGLQRSVAERLDKYIVADDVQVVDVSEPYGLLSVQGPNAALLVRTLELFQTIPVAPFEFLPLRNPRFGEVYLMNQPRLGTIGFDLFVPRPVLQPLMGEVLKAGALVGGRTCSSQAFELARVEAGIPRFGVDMDESHFPQECGLESRAVSFTKGCYIGQEVLNRLHTMGHVNRRLCAFELADNLAELPRKGDRIFHDGKEAGYLTSAVVLPETGRKLALGYLRNEFNRADFVFRLYNPEQGPPLRIRSLN